MKTFEVKSFTNSYDLVESAASLWLEMVAVSDYRKESHCIALSGGRISRNLFGAIVEQSRGRGISVQHVNFFWADERCLPPEDPESNFKTAHDLLLQPLQVPEENIHRLRGEDEPGAAVAEANLDINRVARFRNGAPVLDLIFLGMGEDGHIASVFPDASEDVLSCTAPYLFVPDSPKPPPRRITLSPLALAAAKNVFVLASGAGKEKALQESLSADGETPLARLLQARQQTTIFTDIVL